MGKEELPAAVFAFAIATHITAADGQRHSAADNEIILGDNEVARNRVNRAADDDARVSICCSDDARKDWIGCKIRMDKNSM